MRNHHQNLLLQRICVTDLLQEKNKRFLKEDQLDNCQKGLLSFTLKVVQAPPCLNHNLKDCITLFGPMFKSLPASAWSS